MSDPLYKYPRLHLNASFAQNAEIPLDQAQNHYLKNVLRQEVGGGVRVFNGRDGEWLASIKSMGKKSGIITLDKLIKAQPDDRLQRHLLFSPIKKQRMDFLIEKAVELGVTHLSPVLMNRTENRKINQERIQAHIIEACEQSERLDIPMLLDPRKFSDVLRDVHDIKTYVALERFEGACAISSYTFQEAVAFIIGPEGGFDEEERRFLIDHPNIYCIHLGDTILRAETAALACLARSCLA